MWLLFSYPWNHPSLKLLAKDLQHYLLCTNCLFAKNNKKGKRSKKINNIFKFIQNNRLCRLTKSLGLVSHQYYCIPNQFVYLQWQLQHFRLKWLEVVAVSILLDYKLVSEHLRQFLLPWYDNRNVHCPYCRKCLWFVNRRYPGPVDDQFCKIREKQLEISHNNKSYENM